MQTFTFFQGELKPGISVQEDERLGTVVYLGESGRGRRWEKVGLFRKNPAEITDGRAHNAHPVKITVNRGTDREREFYTLAKPHHPAKDGAVLVRVNTRWTYTRNSTGHWKAHEGAPETLVYGYGAHGAAGRIGTWVDGIVLMRPGDVLRVKPEGGYKSPTYALWVGKGGTPRVAEWDDYENLRALEATEEGEDVEVLFGRTPAYTYSASDLQPGIETESGKAGTVVALGESGRGREYAEVPVLGETTGDTITEAAVALLSESKGIYALLTEEGELPDASSSGAALLRVPVLGKVHRRYRRTEVLRGEPVSIGKGMAASGAAGFAGSVSDTVWVLNPGDAVVLTVGVSESDRVTVIENCNGSLTTIPWREWEEADAAQHPDRYVQSGKAPWGHVPDAWTGRIVHVIGDKEEWDSREGYVSYRRTLHIGEVVSADPLKLNLGWDGCDYYEVVVEDGIWVELNTERVPNRPEGEELAEREKAKTDVERLRSDLDNARESDLFEYLDPDLREKVIDLAECHSFIWDDEINIEITSTHLLQRWVEQATEVMQKVQDASGSASKLGEETKAGNVLPEFEAWHRRGGVTRCGDGWVIRPDGSLREPDEKDVPRFKSDGTYRWNLVTEEELALTWGCGTTRDVDGSSYFTVKKLPVGGLTDAQLEAVAAIESDIGASQGVFGLDPEIKAEKEQLHESVLAACEKSRILTNTPEDLDITVLSGDWGMEVPLDDISGDLGDYVSHHEGFNEHCANREAQIVEAIEVGQKELQLLAYHKFGYWNLNIRLR